MFKGCSKLFPTLLKGGLAPSCQKMAVPFCQVAFPCPKGISAAGILTYSQRQDANILVKRMVGDMEVTQGKLKKRMCCVLVSLLARVICFQGVALQVKRVKKTMFSHFCGKY